MIKKLCSLFNYDGGTISIYCIEDRDGNESFEHEQVNALNEIVFKSSGHVSLSSAKNDLIERLIFIALTPSRKAGL